MFSGLWSVRRMWNVTFRFWELSRPQVERLSFLYPAWYIPLWCRRGRELLHTRSGLYLDFITTEQSCSQLTHIERGKWGKWGKSSLKWELSQSVFKYWFLEGVTTVMVHQTHQEFLEWVWNSPVYLKGIDTSCRPMMSKYIPFYSGRLNLATCYMAAGITWHQLNGNIALTRCFMQSQASKTNYLFTFCCIVAFCN